MADIENTNVDGGATVTAEPAECSRRTFTCLLGIATVALFAVFQYSLDFDNFHPVAIVGMLALFLTGWFIIILSMLVIDWWRGNPGERRVVDSLIESDRCFLLESVHQFLRHTDPHAVYA